MNPTPYTSLVDSADLSAPRPYEKPEIKRVDLALAETLGTGCKLATDTLCVGPPITAEEGGS